MANIVPVSRLPAVRGAMSPLGAMGAAGGAMGMGGIGGGGVGGPGATMAAAVKGAISAFVGMRAAATGLRNEFIKLAKDMRQQRGGGGGGGPPQEGKGNKEKDDPVKKEAATNMLRNAVSALDGLKAKMLDLVGAASPEAVSTFTLSLQLLKAELGEILLPVVIKVAGWIQQAAFAFRSLSPEVKATIGTIAAWAAAVGGAVLVFGNVALALKTLSPLLTLVTAGFGGLKTALFALAANPATAAIVALTAALVALSAVALSRIAKMEASLARINKNNAGEFTREDIKESGLEAVIDEEDEGKRVAEATRIRDEARAEKEAAQAEANAANSGIGNFTNTFGLSNARQEAIDRATKANARERLAQAVIDKKPIRATDSGEPTKEERQRLLLSTGNQNVGYSGIEDVRKQLQTKLLKDPLTAELERKQAESIIQMLKVAEQINQKMDAEKPVAPVG